MERLNVYDIINNVKDELERASDLLKDNDEAKESMLLSDIESSLERLEDIDVRLDFALVLALYCGEYNAQNNYECFCDNAKWRDKYIEEASQVEIEYEDGLVDTCWFYNKAAEIAKQLFK